LVHVCYPKEAHCVSVTFNMLYALFWVIPWHLNFICLQTKFTRLGITQKKAYNIQNTAKFWN